ncbi:MAG: hypothetical protein H6Q60_1012 [Oscillospiraceae bacterium]|nr:hypothetical protein [Oscillospiraceae bacterium]
MIRLIRSIFLFTLGGGIYSILEMMFKLILFQGGVIHWSMFLAGGLVFVELASISDVFPWDMPLLLQGVIGSVIITVTELIFGIYFNIYLGMGIWDYSSLPFNLCGQICLPFSLLWIALSIVAVLLNGWLSYRLFGKERPHYKLI